MRKAVVDVGSNSLILVVEDLIDGQWRRVVERTRVTGLGEGTKTTGLIGERGMQASLDALQWMFAEAKELGADSIQAAGTMAVRIATNRQAFLDKAAEQGTPVMILSGTNEAQLGFDSVASDPQFADHKRISIVDPGGQSTELVTAERDDDGWNILFRKSYPVGTLGLRSTHLQDEAPGPDAILRASTWLDDLIGLCYLRNCCGFTIVLGASGTNLVSIRDRLTEWDPDKVHGAYLDLDEIGRAVGGLMRLTDAQRAELVGIEPGREKTIHIGALIVERFLNAIGAPGCTVSVRGWRYALLEQGLPAGKDPAQD